MEHLQRLLVLLIIDFFGQMLIFVNSRSSASEDPSSGLPIGFANSERGTTAPNVGQVGSGEAKHAPMCAKCALLINRLFIISEFFNFK
jgi:hypothetical protein